jgi:hypothetical protein
VVTKSFARRALSFPSVQRVIAGALAIAVMLFFIAVCLIAVDWWYMSQNPSAANQKDLGLGLLMVGVFFLSSLVSIPVGAVAAWQCKKALGKLAAAHAEP